MDDEIQITLLEAHNNDEKIRAENRNKLITNTIDTIKNETNTNRKAELLRILVGLNMLNINEEHPETTEEKSSIRINYILERVETTGKKLDEIFPEKIDELGK